MKKISTLLLSLFITSALFAQSEKGSFYIMQKAGVNSSNIYDSGETTDNRFGFVGGVEAGYQLNNWLGLSMGAVYSQQGLKGIIFGEDATLKLDYINVPMTANFYVVKGLALKTGIQVGLMVNDRVHVKKGVTTTEIKLKDLWATDSHNHGEQQKVDVSIPFGISYEIYNVMIDVRYNLGLNTFAKGFDKSPKNSVLQFTVGYKFNL